jgi:hypothetical protein
MSTVRFKPGVEFAMVAPGGYKILSALKTIAKTFPKDITITAGTDGKHAKTSRHYIGAAYDVRSHDQTKDEQQTFLAYLDRELGNKQFYYFLEAPGTTNAHWHIQVRAGVVYTVKDLLA